MDPEVIEFFRNTKLIESGKIDAFALAAIAQGCIVDFNFGCHKTATRAGRNVYDTGARLQSPNRGGALTGGQKKSKTTPFPHRYRFWADVANRK